MRSVWSENTCGTTFGCLDGDKSTDILIIGGGMAGVLCAYMLHAAGADYCLVEADRIGGGITKNTTAKITSQHGFIYSRIMRGMGFEKARLYYKANEEALNAYRTICRDIDCDFETKAAYVYSTQSFLNLKAELCALNKIGADAVLTEKLPLPISTVGAVKFKNQAQFDPLKFLYAVSKDLNIYEHTRVLKLNGGTAITDRGRIRAKRVIVATHFPFINTHGMYFLKLYQSRSYVLALEDAQQVDGMYLDGDGIGPSFRNYGQLLLIGGGGHRTGKDGGGFDQLRGFANENYPRCIEKYYWATQDCMSLDGIPYIGRYSPHTPQLYVATGFNKWGMTSSMVSARLLCDMMEGKHSPYEALFSPRRSIMHVQLGKNMLEAAGSLLSFTPKRCPHMGCALKWNKQEHTWDCPCHGSRFERDGGLIDGPAQKDLEQ